MKPLQIDLCVIGAGSAGLSATAFAAQLPYGRVGAPEDSGKAAVWLASDDSDYVTGTTLFVDGGMSLYPAFRDNG